MRLIAALILTAFPAFAEGERAGTFDYYVLALSWSPNWCLREGDARASDQCDADTGYGWTLHGLWPQYEEGWPSYCPTIQRDPSGDQTGAMVDIMGSSGLAFHQWKKHGRCSGLSPAAYFESSRQAYASIARPDVFRRLDRDIRLPAGIVEDAFLAENEALSPDMITVTCKSDMIAEVRICLDKELRPRDCGGDVVRDCKLERALFTPLR